MLRISHFASLSLALHDLLDLVGPELHPTAVPRAGRAHPARLFITNTCPYNFANPFRSEGGTPPSIWTIARLPFDPSTTFLSSFPSCGLSHPVSSTFGPLSPRPAPVAQVAYDGPFTRVYALHPSLCPTPPELARLHRAAAGQLRIASLQQQQQPVPPSSRPAIVISQLPNTP
ncbi:hypothetical protein GALMADRAFT_148123 [Galerina marginata CBS 339.88]|uniref:Uncharacterized protein n=1 Tax=Galerina marginata (strain CBS 339.88) TaxID=685588 RepID=A0A067S801_GALM3|nr:hypothetical protein GALMADRAFT_148123 [Galerina marginata CBS 339.88]